MKVCVIGAGAGGLSAAKHSLEAGLEVVVFEKSDEIGGMWVYREETGKYKYGLDIHTSNYRGLRTNLPREAMGYPDFPITIGEKSFLTADEVQSFHHIYADYFDLKRHIKLLHSVILVQPYAETQWKITTKDLANNRMFSSIFDFVLICNGINNSPHIPIYRDQDKFLGKQLHSHEYRSKDIFRGEQVLIVGSGASAYDLFSDAKEVATYVVQSYRGGTVNMFSHYNIGTRYPDIDRFTSKEVVFVDGRKEIFSMVVYCTGYCYNFPFLSPACGITTKGNDFVSPLWQHCININGPTMAFIGLCHFVPASQIMDIQIRFTLKFFTGVKSLPSREEMLASEAHEIAKRFEKGIKKAHYLGVPFLDQYQRAIARLAQIKPLSPTTIGIFMLIQKIGESDLLSLRNHDFKIVNNYTFTCSNPVNINKREIKF
ncbi:Flavin-containing monooxygenase [Sergentomyia squamirostris]